MKKIAYPIRAVSKLTGISIDTLRAWERRYEAIKPDRSERERVYDETDVRRLILLRKAVEAGHAISTVAELSNEDLERMNERSAALAAPPPDSARAAHSFSGSLDITILHDAIRRFDCLEFDQELNRLAAALPPRNLIHQVVVPLMSEVGDQWYRGDLSVAQEHMVSGALRNLLGSLVRLYMRHKPAATLLFATPKGERHEFGILCAAMLAASGGLGIAYLGPDLPHAEIIEAAQKTKAGVLVLGLKAAVSGRESAKELHRISQKLPSAMELWVGGVRSANIVREIKSMRAIYLQDLADFERELMRSGASF